MRPVITRKSAPALRTRAFALLLPILCVLAAGCAPDDFANSNDPYFGVAPPPRPPGAPYQPVAGATVPPLPASNPSPSLAGLTVPTPRISDPSAPGGPAPATTTPSVALGAPQALPSAAAVPPKPSDVQLAGNVTAAPSAEALMAQLKALGVTRCVIQPTDQGQILLTCFMPDRANPNQQKHYEAPPQRDLASAMQAVLDAIRKYP